MKIFAVIIFMRLLTKRAKRKQDAIVLNLPLKSLRLTES